MNYDVIFSREAEQTLGKIKEQINSRWGKHQVIKFEKRVEEVINLIAQSPFVYKSTSHFPNVHKGFVHRNCSIFYKIDDTIVTVLFFIDNRQDPIFS